MQLANFVNTLLFSPKKGLTAVIAAAATINR